MSKTVREIVQLMPLSEQLQVIEDYEEQFPLQENYGNCFLRSLIVQFFPDKANQVEEYDVARDFAFEVYRFHYHAFGKAIHLK